MTTSRSGDEINPDPDYLPPYWRMDLNINKKIAGKLDISLNINNMLNRKNAVSAKTGYPNGIAVEPGIYTVIRCSYKF